MDPMPMNKGYRRLFWSGFFMLLCPALLEAVSPWYPGIIGLLLSFSGTGLIYRESGSARAKQAHQFAVCGIVIWVLQFLLSMPLIDVFLPWELRFLSCFLAAVIILPICVNSFTGAGELLGGTWVGYFSKRAAVFTVIYTLITILYMAGSFFQTETNSPANWPFIIAPLLQLLLGMWFMNLMAGLRRNYLPLTP